MLFESGGSRAMRFHLHPAIRVSVLESPWLRSAMFHFRGPRSSWRRNGTVCLLRDYCKYSQSQHQGKPRLFPSPSPQIARELSCGPTTATTVPHLPWRIFPDVNAGRNLRPFQPALVLSMGQISPTALNPSLITAEITSSGGEIYEAH